MDMSFKTVLHVIISCRYQQKSIDIIESAKAAIFAPGSRLPRLLMSPLTKLSREQLGTTIVSGSQASQVNDEDDRNCPTMNVCPAVLADRLPYDMTDVNLPYYFPRSD